MKKKYIRKRQRARADRPGSQVMRILANKRSHAFQLTDATYMGANPEYASFHQPGMPEQFKQVAPGIPFVRIR